MTTAERREQRQQLNKETSALYKEQGISPAAGCLPTLLQLPIFWILYGTIRGLTHEMVIRAKLTLQPLYVSHVSRLYAASSPPTMAVPAFGIDLADTARTAGLSWPGRIPYLVVVVGAVALQYLQTKLLNAEIRPSRGPIRGRAVAEDRAAGLRGDLHLDPGRGEHLLRRLRPRPPRPAGVHLPSRSAVARVDREVAVAIRRRPEPRPR